METGSQAAQPWRWDTASKTCVPKHKEPGMGQTLGSYRWAGQVGQQSTVRRPQSGQAFHGGPESSPLGPMV